MAQINNGSFSQHLLLSQAIPTPLVSAVFMVSLLPVVLTLLGVDFGLTSPSAAELAALPADYSLLAAGKLMLGPQVHLVLEWSAIIAAFFTAGLAFSHYWMTGNVTTPIIGVSLACAGLMDVVHSLLAMGALASHSSPDYLLPLSWAVARILTLLILMSAVAALFFAKRKKQRPKPLSTWFIVSAGLLLAAYLLGFVLTPEAHLVRAIFPSDIVKRPYDVFPLILCIFAAAFVLSRYKAAYPSVFADALLLSMVPAIVLELHLVFGSRELYDSHFNVAHFLKLVTYTVPGVGLILDYYATYSKDKARTTQLHDTYRELEARTAELLASNKSLEKSNQYKSEFMANMSYELRTPLNSVIGFSRLLLKDIGEGRNPRGQRAIEAIFRNSSHLLGVINDILDLSKIDAGRMAISRSDFYVSDAVEDIREKLLPLAEEKRLELNVINYARNAVIVSDEVKFKQILLNLGTNAIKFTKSGSVTISVSRENGGALGSAIKIAIKDTGVGIADADKEKLFTEMGRIQDADQQALESTGLGLMLSARLVHLLGGSIEFDSEYGIGSEFRVCFPMASVEERSDNGQWDKRGLCIVCIDHDVDMLQFYSLTFKGSDITVFTERDTANMLALCEDVLPDAICFESHMPEVSSSTLLRAFYNHPMLRDIPKIAISSYHENKKQVLSEGADVFLCKPCDPGEILNQIYRCCFQQITSVLLVGAEPDHAGEMEEQLTELMIQPFFVADAEAAEQKLTQFLPDFIVINLGNIAVEAQRLIMSLANDEQCRKIPQILYNGLEQQRKLTFGNDVQEELRIEQPSAREILKALFTMRRRVKTSLMRIELVNRSLQVDEKPGTEVVVDSDTLDNTPSRQVLVVEDSKDSRDLLDWILEDAQVEHDCVASGREALKAVMQKRYGLLLLDVNLPDLDGREVTRRLRATKSYRHVPIVAVSASTTPLDISDLQSCGINSVVAKPIEQDKLMLAVHQHLP